MNICVFCASSTPHKSEYLDAARQLGQLIANNNQSLYYGGSNLGLMGAVSSAAYDRGGHVCAVIPTFFSNEIINSQPVSELIKVESMSQRKEYLISESDAFIALPGGIGTLDEVMEVLVYNQLGPLRDNAFCPKPIGLYNPDHFWDTLLEQIRVMGENGFFRQGKAPCIISNPDIEALHRHLTLYVSEKQ